jgi:hypothetical protein
MLVVRLTGLPRGAQVFVDGSRRELPIRLTADGKEHRLEVKKRGYRKFVKRFTADAERSATTIEVRMRRRHRRHRRPPRAGRRPGAWEPPAGRRPPVRRPRRGARESGDMTSDGLYKNPFD